MGHYQHPKKALWTGGLLALPLMLLLLPWLLQPFSGQVFSYESLLSTMLELSSWLGLLTLLHALCVVGFVAARRKAS